MNARTQAVGPASDLVRKENTRVFRIWVQTIVPPAITTALYFLIFGNLIGKRIGQMGGYDYAQYIAPGLIMMQVITNAYGNVVSSFFSAKMQQAPRGDAGGADGKLGNHPRPHLRWRGARACGRRRRDRRRAFLYPTARRATCS